MFRSIALSSLGLASLVTLNAGQIFVGTGPAGINGLTGTVTAGVTSADSKVNPGLATSTTNVTAAKYSGSLFLGETTSALPNGDVPGGSVITAANGVSFALVDENPGASSTAPATNAWLGANYYGNNTNTNTPNTSSFTIPINVSGLLGVDTLLNDTFGLNGISDSTVTFNFATAGPLTFTLYNGKEIRSATQCGATSTGTCTTLARTIDGVSYNTTGNTVAVAGVPNVTSFNVYTGSYTGESIANSKFFGTTGAISLDAQRFSFGTSFQADTLQNIVITSTDSDATPSRLALSAVTLETNTSATPEPSTMVLFGGSLLALATAVRRRKLEA